MISIFETCKLQLLSNFMAASYRFHSVSAEIAIQSGKSRTNTYDRVPLKRIITLEKIAYCSRCPRETYDYSSNQSDTCPAESQWKIKKQLEESLCNSRHSTDIPRVIVAFHLISLKPSFHRNNFLRANTVNWI